MKNILVTGGLGFIGSHTCIELIKNNNNLFIIDSLANSTVNVFNNINLLKTKLYSQSNSILKFFKGDIRDKLLLDEIFKYAYKVNLKIDTVIHLAGLKSVSDSIKNPESYWEINFRGTKNLIEVMQDNNCYSIVFSSSATIYGNNNIILSEESKKNPVNIYGKTKLSVEKYLEEKYCKNPSKWNIINLRYFNPIGAHSSGILGESILNKPTNIFTLLCMAAFQEIPYLKIYGNNWNTLDGTAIRDYIHIMDIAKGHLCAMKYLSIKDSGIISINLGTGKGTSVLELINIFEKVNKIEIKYKFAKRREGDVARYVASNVLARKIIKWEAEYPIEKMCKDGWLWYLSTKQKSI